MHWKPQPFWRGEDVYIIGGGPSLRQFDWELLRGKPTIGCNGAYQLGAKICQIVVWGDIMWWEKIGKKGTEGFGGLVVGCTGKIARSRTPWLLSMPRAKERKLGTDCLMWGGNTGCLAINLALILGAKRVLLLGFDMRLGAERRANWHDERYEDANESVFKRFLQGMDDVARTLPEVFPGSEILHITDGSALNAFPKTSIQAHFGVKV